MSSQKKQQINSTKDSMETRLAFELLKLDQDVFAVAILGFDGKIEAYAAKDFLAKELPSDMKIWVEEAQRQAMIVKLVMELDAFASDTTGIVFMRKMMKQVLIPVPSKKIIIEAIMPLWNHSDVFLESVQQYFGIKNKTP